MIEPDRHSLRRTLRRATPRVNRLRRAQRARARRHRMALPTSAQSSTLSQRRQRCQHPRQPGRQHRARVPFRRRLQPRSRPPLRSRPTIQSRRSRGRSRRPRQPQHFPHRRPRRPRLRSRPPIPRRPRRRPPRRPRRPSLRRPRRRPLFAFRSSDVFDVAVWPAARDRCRLADNLRVSPGIAPQGPAAYCRGRAVRRTVTVPPAVIRAGPPEHHRGQCPATLSSRPQPMPPGLAGSTRTGHPRPSALGRTSTA